MPHPAIIDAPLTHHILLCQSSSCTDKGGNSLLQAAKAYATDKGWLYHRRDNPTGCLRFSTTGCMGLCSVGPAVQVYPEGHWYQDMNEETITTLLDEYLGQLTEASGLLKNHLARTLP